MKNTPKQPTPEAGLILMLLTKRELARELRISVRKVDDLKCRGLLPGAVRIGRSVRWRATDIAKWVELGCPSREVFEAARLEGGVR